jgi:hypothetical protein
MMSKRRILILITTITVIWIFNIQIFISTLII